MACEVPRTSLPSSRRRRRPQHEAPGVSSPMSRLVGCAEPPEPGGAGAGAGAEPRAADRANRTPPILRRADAGASSRDAPARSTGGAAQAGLRRLPGARRRSAALDPGPSGALARDRGRGVAVVLAASSGSHPNSAALPAGGVKVLIPEGKTRAQIAEIAKAKGLTGSYSHASGTRRCSTRPSYGAPKGTPDLEGFLFPATYDIHPGAPAARLVEEQLAAFNENFGPPRSPRAKALHVTPYQLLIVASMVEREAQVPGRPPEDRSRDLQPPRAGHAARDRRDDLLRGGAREGHRHLHPRTDRSRSCTSTRPTTPAPTPACRRRRSPTRGWPRSKRPPTRRTSPTSTTSPGADGCGEQVFSNTQAAFEVERRRLPGGGRQERRATRRSASTSDAPPRRPRLAGRPQPLAGDAQRRPRRAGDGRLALPAPAGAAGAVRARRRGRSAERASSAPT